MDEVLTASVQFPTVVFTVLLVVALTLWILPLFGGDLDGAAEGAEEATEGLLEPLGLAEVPVNLVLSIIALTGWAVSVLIQITLLDGLSGTGALVVAVVVLIAVLAAAYGLTLLVGPRIARRMQPTFAPNAADLVGRTVEVRSVTVGREHGYGDARGADGTTMRVDIRSRSDLGDTDNTIGAGDVVLIVDYDADAGSYVVDQLPKSF